MYVTTAFQYSHRHLWNFRFYCHNEIDVEQKVETYLHSFNTTSTNSDILEQTWNFEKSHNKHESQRWILNLNSDSLATRARITAITKGRSLASKPRRLTSRVVLSSILHAVEMGITCNIEIFIRYSIAAD